MGERNRLLTALAAVIIASGALADSANYKYTPLPTQANGITLGVAFSVTDNGSILYEAAQNGQVGYAIVDSHGNAKFTALGPNVGAQSMNDDHWVVGHGPNGAV